MPKGLSQTWVSFSAGLPPPSRTPPHPRLPCRIQACGCSWGLDTAHSHTYGFLEAVSSKFKSSSLNRAWILWPFRNCVLIESRDWSAGTDTQGRECGLATCSLFVINNSLQILKAPVRLQMPDFGGVKRAHSERYISGNHVL